MEKIGKKAGKGREKGGKKARIRRETDRKRWEKVGKKAWESGRKKGKDKPVKRTEKRKNLETSVVIFSPPESNILE